MRCYIALWTIAVLLAAVTFAAGIGAAAYWTVPKMPVTVQGGLLVQYDPAIGYVPAPNTATRRSDFAVEGNAIASYRVFNDARGARVTRAREASPAQVDILFVGDSFTWGHGVEAESTFAHRVPAELGKTGVNLAMASYGTTQSLQMLRRNLDLSPRLVVYPFIADHLVRNVLPCARSYTPICLDVSHVVFDAADRLRIAAPRSDGATRLERQRHSDYERLEPLTWLLHGMDLVYGRILWAAAQKPRDPQREDAALEYLLAEMAKSARAAGARLLFVYLPTQAPHSDLLGKLAAKLGVSFLDLSPAYEAHRSKPENPPLTGPDHHPSVAGHALIGAEIVSVSRSALGQERTFIVPAQNA